MVQKNSTAQREIEIEREQQCRGGVWSVCREVFSLDFHYHSLESMVSLAYLKDTYSWDTKAVGAQEINPTKV